MSKKRNLGRLRTSPDALQRVPASRLIILRPPHEDAVGTRTIISRTLTVAVRLHALERLYIFARKPHGHPNHGSLRVRASHSRNCSRGREMFLKERREFAEI